MKKLSTVLFLSFFMAVASPAFCSPADETPVTNTQNKTPEVLMNRLQEIKDMDKENLSRNEKKDLRKEVKNIRKELKEKKNGIYLSVGAIIIIILLLILLL